MPTSTSRSRLETLRWRYDDERRRSSTQTTLGLFGLCALALAFCGNLLMYGLAGGAASPVSGIFRALLLVLGVGSLLLAAIFFVRSLFAGSAAADGRSTDLRINPGLAGTPEDAAIETLTSQYALAAGGAARRNDDRGRDLAAGGWSLAGGVAFPVVLLVWLLAASAIIAPAPERPAEISQDHSTVRLNRAGTPTGRERDSEIDGACCLFEDRRPTTYR